MKGNKGEWSEFYAFLKLLADGKVHCANGQLIPYPNRFHKIQKVFRDDSANRTEYEICSEENKVIIKKNGTELNLSQSNIKKEAAELWDFILTLNGSEENASIEKIMSDLKCNGIKAQSSDKADIRLIIHHDIMGDMPEQGFSIKSKAGAEATLINSSGDNTNFVFKIDTPEDKQVETFNSPFIKNYVVKFAAVNDCSIEYLGVVSDTLRFNLRMIDGDIEKILASCLLFKYTHGITRIKDIVRQVALKDPLDIKAPNNLQIYQVKMKRLLMAAALGFTPASPWDGKNKATGGFIVVKDDGNVVCIHFYDKDDLEDYLFENTCLETPSSNRHNFGKIYKENGEYFVKLNLQIRFTN